MKQIKIIEVTFHKVTSKLVLYSITLKKIFWFFINIMDLICLLNYKLDDFIMILEGE
jgi:hypothetical protein